MTEIKVGDRFFYPSETFGDDVLIIVRITDKGKYQSKWIGVNLDEEYSVVMSYYEQDYLNFVKDRTLIPFKTEQELFVLKIKYGT
jgi:hypothetical protein